MVRRKRSPELRVVFDTSALYTKAASDLLSSEVNSLIKENSSHPDLKITWYLPDMVRCEREFQMRQAAIGLLPNVEKLERLLDHNLNITPDILEMRVGEAIERSLKFREIRVLPLSVENVDWTQLILNSAYRKPPFEKGQYEKGFRDAIIVETFLQLVDQSPKTPEICRLALVSKDNLLREAVKARTESNINVKLVATIGELEGLINTLVANVTEEFIETIREKADNLFFQTNDNDTLYYKERLADQIQEKFSEELIAVPEIGQFKENRIWYVGPSNFAKKEGPRVFWSNTIMVEADIYRYAPQSLPPPSLGESISGLSVTGSGYVGGLIPPIAIPVTASVTATSSGSATLPGSGSATLPGLATILGGPPLEKLKVGSGKSSFEITWSVHVNSARKFTRAKIEDIKFLKTTWE